MSKYKLLRGQPYTRSYIMMKYMLDKGLGSDLFGKPLLQIGGQFVSIIISTNSAKESDAYIIEEGLHDNLDYQFINISEIENNIALIPVGKNWEYLDAKIVNGHLEPKYHGNKYIKYSTRYPYGCVKPRIEDICDGVIVPTVHYGSNLENRHIFYSNISMNPDSSFIQSITSSNLPVYIPEVAFGEEISHPYSYDIRTGLPVAHISKKTVDELIKITGDNSFEYSEESYNPREIDPKSPIKEIIAVKCIKRPRKRKINERD